MYSAFNRLNLKLKQCSSFLTNTRTPASLILDSLKLKNHSFVAVSSDGIKLLLEPRSGDSFTFFENLVRRDYLSGGIALAEGDTVVDIGANIGCFTVLAASIVGPSGKVFSFEPVPRTADRLRANVALNGFGNVNCFTSAVDGWNGILRIRVMGKSAHSTSHLNLKGTEIEVPVTTLEAALKEAGIDRVKLLKVDCEGSEYGIFANMKPETAGKIDQIAIEVHEVAGQSTAALLRRIRELGFEVHERVPCWLAFNRRSCGGKS